jgi:hypothetical protein
VKNKYYMLVFYICPNCREEYDMQWISKRFASINSAIRYAKNKKINFYELYFSGEDDQRIFLKRDAVYSKGVNN